MYKMHEIKIENIDIYELTYRNFKFSKTNSEIDGIAILNRVKKIVEFIKNCKENQ